MNYCNGYKSIKRTVFEWQGSHIRYKKLLLRQLLLNQRKEILCNICANKIMIWRRKYVLSISASKITHKTSLWQWIQESLYWWPRLVSCMTEMLSNWVIYILDIFFFKILIELGFRDDFILLNTFMIVTAYFILAVTKCFLLKLSICDWVSKLSV